MEMTFRIFCSLEQAAEINISQNILTFSSLVLGKQLRTLSIGHCGQTP